MLDAFIIEELKRRERLEEERRQDAERPFLEIPIPVAPEDAMPFPVDREERKPERGVIVIDFSV